MAGFGKSSGKHRSSSKDQSDDAYWDSSSNAAKFNLFDDAVDLETAKRTLSRSLWEDEDVDLPEDIGDHVLPPGYRTPQTQDDKKSDLSRSARFRPPGTGATSARGTARGGSTPVDLDLSNTGSRGSARGTYGNSGGFADISIQDAVGGARQPSLTDVSKLESEIFSLKRQLQAAKQDRFSKVSTKETVKRIIHGLPVSLEMYKSKQEKLQLLAEALALNDGNAIIAVVLFLRNTLKTSVFNAEIMKHGLATSQYINYLQQMEEWKQLEDFYLVLERVEEAAMLKYQKALVMKNPVRKVEVLKENSKYFRSKNLIHDAALIEEQITLLNRQLPVDEEDAMAQMNGDPKFQQIPRAASIVDRPVLTTLFYCCLYHYNLGPNSLASPAALRNAHNLSDKQFVWIALRARAKLQQWNDIEALFQVKGMLGRTKMKPIISFDKVVQTLTKMGAPREVKNKYCGLISDPDLRLEIGDKYECHETVIETLKTQRDRQRLNVYCNKLKPQSQEWFYAQDSLKSNTKWKN